MHPVAIICYGFICHYVQRIVFFVISLFGVIESENKNNCYTQEGNFPIQGKRNLQAIQKYLKIIQWKLFFSYPTNFSQRPQI